MDPGRRRWAERFAVAALLVFAFALRVGRVSGGFDREMEGWQGSFFAITAVNYERFGVGAFAGYPSMWIDPPAGLVEQVEAGTADERDTLVYANHPPLVPLLAWSALTVGAPAGWNEAWKEHRAPEGIEVPLRIPFFALHMLGLFTFAWALREALGARVAVCALFLLAMSPVSVMYAALVNYENPSLPFVFLALGFYARWVQSGQDRELRRTAISLAAGTCVTWAPLFFVPAMALHALARRNGRKAVRVATVTGIAALVPLIVHSVWAAASGVTRENALERARVLLSPMFDGSAPISRWFGVQIEHMRESLTTPALVIAVGGLMVLAARRLAPERDTARRPVDIATPMLLGGLFYCFAFYKHTLEEQRIFLLYIAPGVAALGGVLIASLAGRALQLAPGVPIVALAIALLCGVAQHARTRELVTQVSAPGPNVAELRELIPAQSIAVVPRSVGLNLAPAFYSWRNIVPLDSLGEIHALRTTVPIAARMPTYALLPRDVPPNAELIREAPLAGHTLHWTLWKLP